MSSTPSRSSTPVAQPPPYLPISGKILHQIMMDILRAIQSPSSNPSGDVGASPSSGSSLAEYKDDHGAPADGDQNEDDWEGREEGDDDYNENEDRKNEEEEGAVEDVNEEGPENPAVVTALCGGEEAGEDNARHLSLALADA